VGNEGAGVVVAAGSSEAAQALLGKTVALIGGASYSQYRSVAVDQVFVLPEGATPADGASAFVNPLTALGMVETMRLEGHSALVHTAAASNLGQMLNRICIADGVKLVNIVRKPEQAALLRAGGATYVCDTSVPGFMIDLTEALVATGATIAFDTCPFHSPVVAKGARVLMTNSGKAAYYAPGELGVRVAFGSLADCVRSAASGRVQMEGTPWSE